jgi:hypothetical protein
LKITSSYSHERAITKLNWLAFTETIVVYSENNTRNTNITLCGQDAQLFYVKLSSTHKLPPHFKRLIERKLKIQLKFILFCMRSLHDLHKLTQLEEVVFVFIHLGTTERISIKFGKEVSTTNNVGRI